MRTRTRKRDFAGSGDAATRLPTRAPDASASATPERAASERNPRRESASAGDAPCVMSPRGINARSHMSKRSSRNSGSFFLCAVLLLGAGAPPVLSAQGDILVLYALDSDWSELARAGAPVGRPAKIGDRVVSQISLGPYRVRGIQLGSGNSASAISGAVALSRFPARLIVTLGPVGALTDDLRSGDWVEIGSYTAYGSGSWTPEGFRPKHEKEAATGAQGLAAGSWISTRLRHSLLEGISGASLEQRLGVLAASGDAFIQSTAKREELRSVTKADVVEMNLGGIEAVAKAFQIPALHWRVVSDRADDQAAEDFLGFAKGYGGAGGKALAEAIKTLPKDPADATSYPALERLLKLPAPETKSPSEKAR